MKPVFKVRVKKLAYSNTYYAHVEFDSLYIDDDVVNEFTADDFRTLWDKVTFFLLDFESNIDGMVA